MNGKARVVAWCHRKRVGICPRKDGIMETFVQLIALFAPAGAIGMALAAFAVNRLKRDPGIVIERGKPQKIPSDTSLGW